MFSDQAKEIIDSLSQNNILDIEGVLILPMSLWDDVHEQICCETEDCQQILLDEFYKQPNKVLDDVIEKDIAPIFMGDYSYVLLTDDGTCVPVTNDELVEHPELKSCAFVMPLLCITVNPIIESLSSSFFEKSNKTYWLGLLAGET